LIQKTRQAPLKCTTKEATAAVAAKEILIGFNREKIHSESQSLEVFRT